MSASTHHNASLTRTEIARRRNPRTRQVEYRACIWYRNARGRESVTRSYWSSDRHNAVEFIAEFREVMGV